VNTLSPIAFVDAIKRMAKQCKANNLDRWSISWGKFSNSMNKELKQNQEAAGNPILHTAYSDVFIFWQQVSITLDPTRSRHDRRKASKIALGKEKEIRKAFRSLSSENVVHTV